MLPQQERVNEVAVPLFDHEFAPLRATDGGVGDWPAFLGCTAIPLRDRVSCLSALVADATL